MTKEELLVKAYSFSNFSLFVGWYKDITIRAYQDKIALSNCISIEVIDTHKHIELDRITNALIIKTSVPFIASTVMDVIKDGGFNELYKCETPKEVQKILDEYANEHY